MDFSLRMECIFNKDCVFSPKKYPLILPLPLILGLNEGGGESSTLI